MSYGKRCKAVSMDGFWGVLKIWNYLAYMDEPVSFLVENVWRLSQTTDHGQYLLEWHSRPPTICIQKTKIMAPGPITSWTIDGETRETVADFIFGGPKITADGDCSHEIKRPLLLGRKAMTNLDSILKSRDIALPTKVRLVKAMVFPVVMHGCESWTIKKAEHQRTDAFELWCYRRLMRVPWTARSSNQLILKEISLKYSLEGLIRKLKLPILWPPDAKNWVTGKDPDSGKD